jgi:hypothetical protein
LARPPTTQEHSEPCAGTQCGAARKACSMSSNDPLWLHQATKPPPDHQPVARTPEQRAPTGRGPASTPALACTPPMIWLPHLRHNGQLLSAGTIARHVNELDAEREPQPASRAVPPTTQSGVWGHHHARQHKGSVAAIVAANATVSSTNAGAQPCCPTIASVYGMAGLCSAACI